jgi:drug/metabolite transporter (DMT)-like permease
VATSALCYSLFAVFTKHALGEGLRPSDLLVWRFALATPLAWLLVVARARRGGPVPSHAPVRPMLGLGVLFGVIALLAFVSLDHLSAALYTVLIYTYPAMVGVASWLLGRPAPRALWGALVLTMLGIALTVPEVFTSGGDASAVGLVVTVLNAAAYAAYLLVSDALATRPRHGRAPFDGVTAYTWSMTGSLGFAVVVAAVAGVRTPQNVGTALGVAGLAVVSTVMAGWALMIGLSRLGAARAAVIATLEPVLTLVWAVVLLDETLQPVQLVGAALVLAGVVWTQRATLGAPGPRPSAGDVEPAHHGGVGAR